MAARPTARLRPIAGIIGLAFGGLWSALGASGLPQDLRAPAEAAGGLVTAALIAALWLRRAAPPSGSGLFRRPAYLIAVGIEIVAIYTASTFLTRHGLQAYLISAVGVIVGLHFIGLWQATRLPRFLWIAGGMCAVSALSAGLPNALGDFSPRSLVAGVGNALVLWVGAGLAFGPKSPPARAS